MTRNCLVAVLTPDGSLRLVDKQRGRRGSRKLLQYQAQATGGTGAGVGGGGRTGRLSGALSNLDHKREVKCHYRNNFRLQSRQAACAGAPIGRDMLEEEEEESAWVNPGSLCICLVAQTGALHVGGG